MYHLYESAVSARLFVHFLGLRLNRRQSKYAGGSILFNYYVGRLLLLEMK